jgi:hypothetical protein
MAATKNEVVSTRKTFDGRTVELWSDGAMTFGNGQWVPGAGAARTDAARAANLRAGFAVMGNVCVLLASEVGAAVKAARKAEASGKLPAEVIAAA